MVAEKLRQNARDLEICLGALALPPLSISVGVAAYPLNGSTAEAVLRAADIALYRAKAEGRDRVVVADVEAAVATGIVGPVGGPASSDLLEASTP